MALMSLWHIIFLKKISYVIGIVLNQIHHLLGLFAVATTPEHEREKLREKIREIIFFKGATSEDLEALLGEKEFGKNKLWIERCLEDFKIAKFCPSCEKFFLIKDLTHITDQCRTCKGDLVKADEYFKLERAAPR